MFEWAGDLARTIARKTWDSLVGWPLSAILMVVVITSVKQYYPDQYIVAETFLKMLVSKAVLLVGETIFYSLIVGIVIFSLLWRRCSISNSYQRRRNLLIESFGVSYFSNREVVEEQQADWDFFVSLIKSENPNTLRLLGASGFETFCKTESPLKALLEDFPGEVKVLLLEPNSDSVKERAASLDYTSTKYSKEIRESIDYLFSAQVKSRVEARYYDRLPDWKMVMSDQNLWLQYYMPGDHVNDCSAYILYRNNNNSSLYNLFSHQFSRIWEAGKPVVRR